MKRYAVIGNPIAHSLSPHIHQLFSEQTQQPLVYEKIVAEPSSFNPIVHDFFAHGGHGLNITAPFKFQAYQLCVKTSQMADVEQSVNVLSLLDDGTLYGDSTDGIGWLNDIYAQHWPLKDQTLLLIGAGGAARAILAACVQEKIAARHIFIYNRTPQHAHALRDQWAHALSIEVLEQLPTTSLTVDLVLQTVSRHADAWLENIFTHISWQACRYYDINYGSAVKNTCQQLHKQGVIATCDGLGMLVEQAAIAFYQWHHVNVDARAALLQLKRSYHDTSLE